MTAGRRIRVRGQVQGVGFRPFVWQLAKEFSVVGEVLNDPEGVLIIAAGGDLDEFTAAITARAPSLSRVDAVEVSAHRFDEIPGGFTIAASRGEGAETRVTPDAATCQACLDEIRGDGRRRGYAFTNCTHCGPRFSILRRLPYDRAKTSMAGFPMCADCRREYEDPADRRFHAQPIACPACGPRLWLETGGKRVEEDPIGLAADMIRDGRILAIKGLGGFHLACDAADGEAVALLRTRKRRPAKPFALMAREGDIADHAVLDDASLALLRDPAAPIVLMASRGTLPDSVAPGLDVLGFMLPYTPLHHLLLDAFGGALVMTSGNLSGEPQAIGNDEARDKLSAFADGFLMHDRDIVRRLDDGVERATTTGPMVLRRARGRAPGTLPLPPGFEDAPEVVAYGAHLKAAICLVKNGQALLSHHLGDLDDALTAEEFEKADADYSALFDHRPAAAACDLHPDYRSTRRAEASGLPVVRVQHHHAHLAAVLGDNGWPRGAGPVAGIVLDGLGLGSDGTVWGGELLLGDYRDVARIAHLKPAPLPGGEAAQREPWRNALVRLDEAGLSSIADRLFDGRPLELLRRAVRASVNAPMSSSAGRLFDAVSAIAGLTTATQSYEGEAAMRLEATAVAGVAPYLFAAEGPVLDPAPAIRAIVADLHAQRPLGEIAGAFTRGLAQAFALPARRLVETGQAAAVALSGGCFQNAKLLDATIGALDGLPVLIHRTVPANDGGIAFGQALVAMERLSPAVESD